MGPGGDFEVASKDLNQGGGCLDLGLHNNDLLIVHSTKQTISVTSHTIWLCRRYYIASTGKEFGIFFLSFFFN